MIVQLQIIVHFHSKDRNSYTCYHRLSIWGKGDKRAGREKMNGGSGVVWGLPP